MIPYDTAWDSMKQYERVWGNMRQHKALWEKYSQSELVTVLYLIESFVKGLKSKHTNALRI